jgi:proline iminopeptidase
MRMTSARGLSYEVHGHGPVCLTLHGGPGMSSGLWPALRPVSAHARIVAYDHRGHGLSTGAVPPRGALAALADDASELVRDMGLDRVAVLGHSNGAFIALHLALRHAAIVDRMIRVGGAASGRFRATAFRNASERADATILRALDRLWNDELADDRAFARAWRTVQPLYFRRPTPSRIERTIAPLRYNLVSRRRILPQYARFDLRRRLRNIAAPTLVVVGRHDWITPPEFAEELARLMPNASVEVFEESGHYPFVEEPSRFAAVAGRFLTT